MSPERDRLLPFGDVAARPAGSDEGMLPSVIGRWQGRGIGTKVLGRQTELTGEVVCEDHIGHEGFAAVADGRAE
jgi:hypothetical protein